MKKKGKLPVKTPVAIIMPGMGKGRPMDMPMSNSRKKKRGDRC